MTAKEMATKYYPKLWGKDRLQALVRSEKLSEDDYKEIVKEEYKE